MSRFAKKVNPDLSEHKVFNSINKIYKTLPSNKRAEIKGLEMGK